MKWWPLFVLICAVWAAPVAAADRIQFVSQPDELAVFFNDIAYARDEITLPGGVDVAVVLPQQVLVDTLVIREDGQRIPGYRLSYVDGQLTLQWLSASSKAVRQATIEYLMSGVGWSPKYDMWLGADDAETVNFDFYAEIRNPALMLEDVQMRLVAGRVDTSQPMDDISRVTANQYLAGYDEAQVAQSFTGTATIQHVYTL
ncbi:MAG: DUF4139 domain-containing protein, partial [Anaerolineae bacterium]|nr:DUF4139 domain-containing protein [Anaerolineae bacterium]